MRIESGMNTLGCIVVLLAASLCASTSAHAVVNAPSGLTATLVSGNCVDLSWTDNSANETGFRIEYKLSTASSYSILSTTAANVTARRVTELNPGATYQFKVKAITPAEVSGDSNICTVKTYWDPPSAPANLTATAGAGRIDLRWTQNGNFKYFLIERSSVIDGPYTIMNISAVTSYSDSVPEGQSFHYRVRALNIAGYSDYSNIVTATALAGNPPPEIISVGGTSSSAITLSWRNRSLSATGYRIYRSSTGSAGTWVRIGDFPLETTTYVDSGMTAGTERWYSIYSLKGTVQSSTSAVGRSVTMGAVVAPQNLRVTLETHNSIAIAWDDLSTGESGVKIERAVVTGGVVGAYTAIAGTAANIERYTNIGLGEGKIFRYRVRANNGATYSPYSNVVSAETKLIQPANLQATVVSMSQINLTWQDNSTAETGTVVKASLVGPDGPFHLQWTKLAANASSFNMTALLPSQTYYIKVCISGASGEETESEVISAKTKTFSNPPSAPSDLSAVSPDYQSVKLSWQDNAVNETEFLIERCPASQENAYVNIGSTQAADVTAFIDRSNLQPETSYRYRVRAHNGAGYSAYSNPIEVWTQGRVEGTIQINRGAAVTINRSVMLTLGATSFSADMADNGKMCFSNDGMAWSAWEDYGVIKEYQLSGNNGNKTVHVKYKDKNNNENTGNISASIQLAEPAKMVCVYYSIATPKPGLVLNFGQRGGVKLYDRMDDVYKFTYTLAGADNTLECKSVTSLKNRHAAVDTLVVDFGSEYGIWAFNNSEPESRSLLHPYTAESITSADINNDGCDELIIDFGVSIANPYKVWIYTPSNESWSALHALSPRSISAGNIDGVQGADLVVDFGIYGLWIYYNSANWVFLHSLTADQIVLGDINADCKDEVVVDFGELYGVWVYYPGVSDPNFKWKSIDAQSPKLMAIGHCNEVEDYKDIVIDYGATEDTSKKSGLWIWADDSTFTFLHQTTSSGMFFQNSDLVINFGEQYGLYCYMGTLPQQFNRWKLLDTNYAE